MKSGLNKGLEEMSPWPKLACHTSTLGMLSSVTAMCVAILSDASPSVICSFIAASFIASVPVFISGKFYVDQKLDKGILNLEQTEEGKFYGRIFNKSKYIAVSSLVAALVTSLTGSLDVYSGAMMVACLAEGVADISVELRDAANIKLLRREVDSLDESREREGSYFANKLRNFDLIGYFKKNREDSLRLNLLQGFAKDEDELSANYSEREKILLRNSPNSGSRYGSSGHTTTSAL